MTPQTRSGLILIHKPAGITSFDCIRSLKRQWHRTDLGHGGTLDQFATGLLPVLAGEGLKLARFFLENHPTLSTYWKTYRAVLTLGYETDTGDPSGEKTEESEECFAPLEQPSAAIQRAMNEFRDKPYLQMPPLYSAKKIKGQRSSDLARAGTPAELTAVSVEIREINLRNINGPHIEFEVTCSKGTYIRVLAQDLARKLNSRGHLTALERTAVGDFTLAEAIPLEQVLTQANSGLHDMKKATSFLPSLIVSGAEIQDLNHGRLIEILKRVQLQPVGAYCLKNEQGTPLALVQCHDCGEEQRRAEFLRAFVTDSD